MDNRTDYINDNYRKIIIKNNTDVFLKALIYDVILGMKIATS
jgi:ribonucleotide reductase beta subunit family protein with ferritin-like domain